MKSERIVRAYDSINPSPAEKARMLDAILAEAALEEKPKQKRKAKEPIVYTAKPTKVSRRSMIGTLAACLAMVTIAGFVLVHMLNQQPDDPAYVEPTTETTVPVTETPEYPDSAYMETLELYRRALDQGWDRTMCVENGMSMLTPIESEYEGLYYAISDLNGDDKQELVISEYPYREDTDTNFIDIYTVLDGHVIQVMSLGDTDMRYLCEGGIVKDLTPPERGDYNAYVSLWQLQEDQFVQTGHVYNIDGQWFHGFRANEKITADEAEDEIKSYKPAKLDFVEIKSSGETEYQSGYEVFDDIIQKYVTAIKEGWTEYQCEQNDISPQILSDTSIQSNLGWCLLDIDENGAEELVISDGVHLFDLYVMQPHNGGPGHLIMANGGETWQLCENGVLQMHGLYSGTSVWRYYTLSEIDLVQRDMLFYEGATNQYSYGADDIFLEPISKEKAGDIISRDRTQELTLTNFVDPAPFEPNEMQYYNPLLDIYRKAIREKWNPGDCAQQGISLMVGYYGDFVEELGYTTMDLDGNGIQELIITDGTNIYDLYTIIQDEITGPLRIIDAMERIEYFLTTDGLIYNLGSGSASVSYYMLYQLNGSQLELQEGYMMDYETNPSSPWYYYDGVERGDPCPHAAAATDAIQFAHIPFTSFE